MVAPPANRNPFRSEPFARDGRPSEYAHIVPCHPFLWWTSINPSALAVWVDLQCNLSDTKVKRGWAGIQLLQCFTKRNEGRAFLRGPSESPALTTPPGAPKGCGGPVPRLLPSVRDTHRIRPAGCGAADRDTAAEIWSQPLCPGALVRGQTGQSGDGGGRLGVNRQIRGGDRRSETGRERHQACPPRA